MPVGGLLGGLVKAGVGLFKASEGKKERRKGEKALRNYERNPLENAYGTTQVSRLGADLQVEEQARQSSSILEALQRSGTRGIIGGAGRLAIQSNVFNRQIGSGLDRQQKELDMLEAQDEARLRMIKEERDSQNLAGIGQRIQQGRQSQQSGLGMIGAGLSMGLSSFNKPQ